MEKKVHIPVLYKEVVEVFEGKELKVFVDATLGAGGHAKLVLEAHPEITHFFGFDQDETALAIAKENLKEFEGKCTFFHKNFSFLETELKGVKVDGILCDLGVSSMQLDRKERGFSFMKEGPLDMRMDTSNPYSAYDLVNFAEEKELCEIFWKWGEEQKGRLLAKLIVRAREEKPIETTGQLVAVLEKGFTFKEKREKNTHPATKAFQAIRIAVNKELDHLESFLPQAKNVLAKGGILAMISFHSLEDRRVKHFFQKEASDKVSTSGVGGMFLDKEPEFKILTKKAKEATLEERELNPRARSAKLRAGERV